MFSQPDCPSAFTHFSQLRLRLPLTVLGVYMAGGAIAVPVSPAVAVRERAIFVPRPASLVYIKQLSRILISTRPLVMYRFRQSARPAYAFI